MERKAVKKEGECGTYIGVWIPPGLASEGFAWDVILLLSLYISKWGRGKVHVLGQVLSAFTDSIEFNQDSNLFAVSRVTQKIKFYDYYSVIKNIA